jgi:uncharacterized protein YndB with AHSA1/START domain
MTRTIEPAPVRRAITVKVSQARAFEVFTKNFGCWWPASHSIGKSPLRNAVIEPEVGGRWYEVGEDGTECEWGKVLAWDPPSRVLLAWQLGADWRFNANLITEVEVRFTPEGTASTLVELEHRHLERMGPAAEAARTAIASDNGWRSIIARYAEFAAQSLQPSSSERSAS